MTQTKFNISWEIQLFSYCRHLIGCLSDDVFTIRSLYIGNVIANKKIIKSEFPVQFKDKNFAVISTREIPVLILYKTKMKMEKPE